MAYVARDGKPPRRDSAVARGEYVLFTEKPVWNAARCMWCCSGKKCSGPSSFSQSEWHSMSKVRLAPGEGPVEVSIVAVGQA